MINGQIFDSSIRRGEPAVFPVSGVIAGWVEALQLMTVGSKWQLYIPSELAYNLPLLAEEVKIPYYSFKIAELCNNYHVTLIEDAAESLGATYKGKQTGTFGTYNAISFKSASLFPSATQASFTLAIASSIVTPT